MLETVAPWAGLLGLMGLAGLLGIRQPAAKGRAGAAIRLLGLFGIAGLVGIWIPGAGAVGAAGALSLWNHQSPRLAFLGKLGWLSLIGIPFLYMWGMA
jgi:hypothetical protein